MKFLGEFDGFWRARGPRERQLLASLAIVVVASLVAQLLWSSHQARGRLGRTVPQLRLQLEAMQRRAADVQKLASLPRPAAPTEGNALLASALTSAKLTGLPDLAKQLQPEGATRLRLRATLPFDQWLLWVATLQQEFRLRVVSARIEPAEEPGLARIEALFGLPEPG